jgi:hypothetical protein
MNILHRHQLEAAKIEHQNIKTRSKTPTTSSQDKAGVRNQGVEVMGHIE